jgi:hypothetical protein
MATVKWSTPGTRSGNLAGTTLNSIATGSETAVVTYDNSTAKDLYGVLTIKLGSITPATGGSITIRVTLNDGTDTADRIGGDLYTIPLTSGAGAKVAVSNMIRLYPFLMRISVINSTGVTTNASGNEIYITPFGEEV